MRILIVGAGIAGLATALALRRAGHIARIVERRAPSDHIGDGAGIQLGPNGTKALAALGLRHRLAPFAHTPNSIRVHDGRSGRLLTCLPLGSWIAARHGAPYWVVHRSDLMRVLIEEAVACGIDIEYGATLPTAAVSDDAVVIGADGLWSQVRAAVFDPEHAVFTGRVAWRTVLPPDQCPQFSRRDVSVWMSPGAHLVLYPIGVDGALNVVLISPGEPVAEHWSGEPSARSVQAHISDAGALAHFHPSLHALAANDGLLWRRWPLMTRRPLGSYAKRQIALVGDAAHPMLPFLAQGGAMALEDALELAGSLTAAKGNATTAFATYAQARVARTHRVVNAAARNGRVYHLDGVLASTRNAALRLLPGHVIMGGYDWLYGGAPEVAV